MWGLAFYFLFTGNFSDFSPVYSSWLERILYPNSQDFFLPALRSKWWWCWWGEPKALIVAHFLMTLKGEETNKKARSQYRSKLTLSVGDRLKKSSAVKSILFHSQICALLSVLPGPLKWLTLKPIIVIKYNIQVKTENLFNENKWNQKP